MRVLQQLITHFWRRGALTLEQAHYFVEHGFVRPEDLSGYQPRQQAEEAEGDGKVGTAAPRPPSLPIMPDVFDELEQALAEPGEVKRKRKKQPPKVPDLTPGQLGDELEGILKARATCFPALVELARPDYARNDARMAAVVLRHVPEDQFPRRLLRVVRARPAALAQLWECLDDQPFHDLVERAGVKGKAIRAFEAVLRSSQPGQWGPGAWITHVPAAQAVANLLAVRRRLLPAVAWLYDRSWTTMARCVQRPPRPRRSWNALGFGLVLLHNARVRLAKRSPRGFPIEKRLTAAGWREAWTTALELDPAAVSAYLIHVFGTIPDSSRPEAEDLSARGDVELICPNEWKV
jgi:hypothetical protein